MCRVVELTRFGGYLNDLAEEVSRCRNHIHRTGAKWSSLFELGARSIDTFAEVDRQGIARRNGLPRFVHDGGDARDVAGPWVRQVWAPWRYHRRREAVFVFFPAVPDRHPIRRCRQLEILGCDDPLRVDYTGATEVFI